VYRLQIGRPWIEVLLFKVRLPAANLIFLIRLKAGDIRIPKSFTELKSINGVQSYDDFKIDQSELYANEYDHIWGNRVYLRYSVSD
jgi:hypothetical protein